jgi:tetratricopeptide (TPR) repeat protein
LESLLGPPGQPPRAVLRPAPAPAEAPVAPAPLGVSWIADGPEQRADTADAADPIAPVQREAGGEPEESRLPVPGDAGAARAGGRPAWFSPARALWLIPFGLLLIGSLIFTVAGTQSRVADRMPGDRPAFGTLNGMDWMDKTVYTIAFDNNTIQGPVVFHFERDALDWLNAHIPGTPVIAEAPLGYYREAGMMVGTYTGIPMVVGGLHQEEQRYDWQVGERRHDMDTFFRSGDVQQALLIMRKYDIQYVYMGQLERLYYRQDAAGLAKFKAMEGKYLTVAHQNDLVTVYRVDQAKVAADYGAPPGSAPAPAPGGGAPAPAPAAPPAVGADDPTLKALQAAVKADANSLDARRALADFERTNGMTAAAIEDYTAVTRLSPQDVAAYHLLGDLYMQNGEPDKALAAWEEATHQAQPADRPAAFNKVGIAYADRRRWDDAITAFQSAVTADPKFVEAWFHLGDAYVGKGDSAQARAAFQSCVKNAGPDEGSRNWAAQAQKRLDTLP